MGTIRLYLALVVVLYHASVGGSHFHGPYAVMLFFVISGFCMALVLNEKYVETNPSRFYVARFLRIWPAYVVVLAVILIASPSPSVPALESVPASAYYWFSAISVLGHETLWWFSPTDGRLQLIDVLKGSKGTLSAYTHMQQMWSVGIELFFYLVAPLFARRPRAIAGLLFLSYAIHLVMESALPRNSPFLVRSALPYFWIFLLGMASYHAGQHFRFLSRIPAWLALPSILASLAVTILAMSFRGTMPDAGIVIFAIALAPLFAATKDLKWDRLIGELSYPLYVVHWPLLPFIFRSPDRPLTTVLTYVGLSILLAAVLHIAVERPVDRWRRMFRGGPLKRDEVEDLMPDLASSYRR